MNNLHSYFSLSCKALTFLIFLLFFDLAQAQEKCGTVPYETLLKARGIQKENNTNFENWIQSRIREKKLKAENTMSAFSVAAEEEPYIIPVVVHIIHNGEIIGQGANISDARVFSQLQSLNEDFRRLNADTVNTPSDFKSSAADTKIEFVLAKRDPEGLPTNGIVRKQGLQNDYSISKSWELKSYSYWPAEDYLNIWVAPLENTLLGFAQFPQSDTEPGLEDASANRLTDGVVIDYAYFGNNSGTSPASKGRTATHEIGHFLGLRHIWGDGDCSKDDFCADTPSSDGANYGCPTGSVTSCGNKDMFQNFMDYTDDVCMNLFTHNQKERMQIVLQYSPRRSSLINSKADEPPAFEPNDIGIKKIITPIAISCENIVAPEIIMRNYGENDIQSFKVLFSVNSDTVDSLYQSITLAPLDSVKVSFPTFELSDTTDFTFSFIVKEANDTIDGNADNNVRTKVLHIPEKTTLPFIENFELDSLTGTLQNPDERIGWEVTTLPVEEGTNKAIKLNCFEYNADVGEKDFFYTPIFDLTAYESAVLNFRVAYAEYVGGSKEGLVATISTDCGFTYPQENIVFEEYGPGLATAARKSNSFIPEGRLEWREVTVDLSAYGGMSNLRLSLAGINDYGNNIYLDDITITGSNDPSYDLKIAALEVSPVTCFESFVPKVLVVNNGKDPVSSFELSASSVWEEDVHLNYTGLPLEPYDTIEISLPEIQVSKGSHLLAVHVEKPNGMNDGRPEDNFKSTQFRGDTIRKELPFREQFPVQENGLLDWFIYNPDNSMTWELIETSPSTKNQAIYLNSYDYRAIHEKDWLISPVLNFAELDFIALSFFISYAYNYNYKDRFQVLVSTDCGQTYTTAAYDLSGENLSSNYASTAWNQEDKSKWQKVSIPLDEFIGEENVRIAFVMNNGYGNNLYLDDIEFFISDEPEHPLPLDKLYVFPNPSRKIFPITFNLKEKEIVQVHLYDLRGKLLFSETFPNTLNQLYHLNLSSLPGAIYVIKITGESFNDTKRIVVEK